ncbi:MAG: DUF4304 domain-containing protein, partial [Clostridia bacterium]|nr:DUF4304 domain-containing protein [Clostridia bacterium]
EVFGPVLLENGFIKKGNCFFRLYGKGFLQMVEFAHTHWSSGQMYIGCEVHHPYGVFAGLLETEGTASWLPKPYSCTIRKTNTVMETFVGERMTEYCRPSGTYEPPKVVYLDRALYLVKDFDQAIQLEYGLFVEKALPKLNAIKDLDAYQAMHREMNSLGRRREYKHTFSRVYCMLEEDEWEKAEESLRIMLEETRRDYDRTMESCKHNMNRFPVSSPLNFPVQFALRRLKYQEKVLEHVTRRDEAWKKAYMDHIQELFRAEMNRLSPRILKNAVDAVE